MHMQQITKSQKKSTDLLCCDPDEWEPETYKERRNFRTATHSTSHHSRLFAHEAPRTIKKK